jgi:hypothetical protein
MNFMREQGGVKWLGMGRYIQNVVGMKRWSKRRQGEGRNGATGIWKGGGSLWLTWHPYHHLNTINLHAGIDMVVGTNMVEFFLHIHKKEAKALW